MNLGVILFVLFWLAVVLAVVTFVGHLIWVVLARLFGGSDEPTRLGSPPAAEPKICPRCDTRLRGHVCDVCSWPNAIVHHSAAFNAIVALRRRLALFHKIGMIDLEAFRALDQALASQTPELPTSEPATQVDFEPIPPQTVDVVEPELVEEATAFDAGEESTTSTEPAVALRPLSTSVDWQQRVQKYTESLARTTAEAATEAPVSQEVPRRRWSDLLAAFMEEKHIRWGELVGGLLIVCCSIALVISFWAKIAERPYLKFFVFNGVTAGLFGLGLYSERRWKLRNTSEGLLITATLLVPLNFLAIAAFSQGMDANDFKTITGELVSIGLFSALLVSAGRIVVPTAAWPLAFGVMLPSVLQLLIRRFVGPAHSFVPESFALVLLAVGAVVNIWPIRWSDKSIISPAGLVVVSLKLLGMSLFAMLLAAGLLLHKAGAPHESFHRFSPFVCLAALVPLSVGINWWRSSSTDLLAGLRTAALSIAVVGTLGVLAGIVLAWPTPSLLVPCALIAAVTFVVVALAFGLPEAYLAAAPCLVAAYLVLVAVLGGELSWAGTTGVETVKRLISGRSGVALLAPVGFFSGSAIGFWRIQRSRDAIWVGIAAIGTAALSVILVGWFGLGRLGDPLGVTYVFLVYSAAVYVVAEVTASRHAIYGAAILLAGSVAQFVVFNLAGRFEFAMPWGSAALATAALLTCGATILSWAPGETRRGVFAPLVINLALAATAVGWTILAARVVTGAPYSSLAMNWLVLAVVCLCLALLRNSTHLILGFQFALAVSTWFAVAMQLAQHDWFRDSPLPWLDPWTIAAQSLALACLTIASQLVRLAVQRKMSNSGQSLAPTSRWRLADLPWPNVDQLVLRLAIVAAIGLAVYSALPGVTQELSPRPSTDTLTDRHVPPLATFEIAGIPHEHARGVAVWVLLAFLAGGIGLESALRPSKWHSLLIMLLGSLACPLIASAWQSEVATASALRWLASGYLFAASIAIWNRHRWSSIAARTSWIRHDSSAQTTASNAIAAAYLLALLPLVAMAAYVGTAAVWRNPPDNNTRHIFAILGAGSAVATLVAAVIHFARQNEGSSTPVMRRAVPLLVILGAAPFVAWTIYIVAVALRQSPILGPELTSPFFRVGLAVSYAVPILLIAAATIGHAIRENSGRLALAGGLVLNVGATAGYLLAIAKSGLKFDAAQWIKLAQLNSITAAGFALAWLGGCIWSSRKYKSHPPAISDYLVTQINIPTALVLLVLVPAWCVVAVNPTWLNVEPVIASGVGWIAMILLAIVLTAAEYWGQWSASTGRQLAKWTAIAMLVACAIGSQFGSWATLYSLMVAHTLLAAALFLDGLWLEHLNFGYAPTWHRILGLAAPSATGSRTTDTFEPDRLPWRRTNTTWGVVCAAAVGWLAGRAMLDEPHPPWGAALGFLAVATILSAFASWSLRRGLLVWAGLAINLATTAIWWTLSSARYEVRWHGWQFDIWQLQVVALSLPAVVWVWIERRWFQANGAGAPRGHWLAMHRLVAYFSLIAVALMILAGLGADVWQPGRSGQSVGQILALAAAAVASSACLWDGKCRDAVALLYFAGLLACGQLLDSLSLSARWLLWLGTITLATYAVATSYLWSRRRGLRAAADLLRIPRAMDSESAHLIWIVPANCAVAVIVIALVFAIELTFAEASLRLMAAKVAMAQALSVGLLARGAVRSPLQYAALTIGAVGAIALGWAPLNPVPGVGVLHRAVVVTAALAVTTACYGLVLTKLLKSGNEWLAAAQRMIPSLIAAAGCSLAFVLGTEIVMFATVGQVVMVWPAILLVALTLLGIVAALLAAAALPGRDPLGLSERGRTAYVYAAEITLALLVLHVRLTMPWLFHGFLSLYWPLIVMLVAMVGAGLGEWLRRRAIVVLGEPLETTGALLPVLPMVGLWFVSAEVNYSLLLLTVGLLYAGLSVARNSFVFGLLAALAANGALWSFLHDWDGYSLLDHPQLWLIPPAVSVLIAAHLNRRQLTSQQLNGVRYGCSVVVYISSTADVFLNGVAEAPWLPLVLAGVSLVGIFSGIWMRVRAFLFLGTGFLLLALLTMIWHAAVDLQQTWIWAASGIVTGVLIIAVFALFEKQRDKVLGVVEAIKEWS